MEGRATPVAQPLLHHASAEKAPRAFSLAFLYILVGSGLRAQKGEARCYTCLYNGRGREGGNLEGDLSTASCPCYQGIEG